jgi:hypothetical protein
VQRLADDYPAAVASVQHVLEEFDDLGDRHS